jgi:hypothetical protein
MKTPLLALAFCVLELSLFARLAPAEDAPTDFKVQEMNCYGKPKAYKERERDVFAMWYDGDKWHVAVKGAKGGKVHYHGRITTSSGQITDMLLFELERNKKRKNADFFVPQANRKGFDFSFANTGGIDGFTFKLGDPKAILECDMISRRDDDPKHNPDIIMIGADSTNPTENPFLLPAAPVNPKEKERQKAKDEPSPAEADVK